MAGLVVGSLHVSKETWNHDEPLGNPWKGGSQKVYDVSGGRFCCVTPRAVVRDPPACWVVVMGAEIDDIVLVSLWGNPKFEWPG